jgi:arylsulfatase A-like enzyme
MPACRHPAASVVQSAMASAYDVLPTLLDYVDLPLPDTNLPGQSLLPVLKNERADGRDSVVIYDEYGFCRMIRTAEWKYIHRYPDGPNELYDVVNDPDDRNNLIDDPLRPMSGSKVKADRLIPVEGTLDVAHRQHSHRPFHGNL